MNIEILIGIEMRVPFIKNMLMNNWFCIIVQNNGKLPFDKSGKGNN